jgi:hypothetical protein
VHAVGVAPSRLRTPPQRPPCLHPSTPSPPRSSIGEEAGPAPIPPLWSSTVNPHRPAKRPGHVDLAPRRWRPCSPTRKKAAAALLFVHMSSAVEIPELLDLPFFPFLLVLWWWFSLLRPPTQPMSGQLKSMLSSASAGGGAPSPLTSPASDLGF